MKTTWVLCVFIHHILQPLLELSVLAECSSPADENCSVSIREVSELKKGQKFLLCLLVDHIWSY